MSFDKRKVSQVRLENFRFAIYLLYENLYFTGSVFLSVIEKLIIALKTFETNCSYLEVGSIVYFFVSTKGHTLYKLLIIYRQCQYTRGKSYVLNY